MKKKVFVISIPMLPAENLHELRYRYPDGSFSGSTRFPGIAMLEKYAPGKEPVKIVTVRTDDENHRTEDCYRLFLRELDQLSADLGLELTVKTEIIVPHSEEEKKSRFLLRELLKSYEADSYVYLDLTYGTKLTSVELFSSLSFAEICRKCIITAVIYGSFTFGISETGELYDVSKLYHMLRFLDTAAHMDRASFNDLIDQMLED